MSDKHKGRPRAGSADLEPLMVRISSPAKKRLMALSQIHGEPAYRLVERAFWAQWESLPEDEREKVETILRLMEEARAEKQKKS